MNYLSSPLSLIKIQTTPLVYTVMFVVFIFRLETISYTKALSSRTFGGTYWRGRLSTKAQLSIGWRMKFG